MVKVMRDVLTFVCEGARLAATLDRGDRTSGLLIVSGGNDIRIGAHRGMALLAGEIAAAGHPVFRFDRRGVGDSEGHNGGFESSGADLVAALTAFQMTCPQVTRIVAFGNCDAATALWLHQPLPIAALVLANPWLVETTTEAPAPAVARSYYRQRLRDPRAWGRFLRGAVNPRRLIGGLASAARHDSVTTLAKRVADQLALFPVDTRILLATRDGTAAAFRAQWDSALFDGYRDAIAVTSLDSASHSFANDADYAALKAALLDALA